MCVINNVFSSFKSVYFDGGGGGEMALEIGELCEDLNLLTKVEDTKNTSFTHYFFFMDSIFISMNWPK